MPTVFVVYSLYYAGQGKNPQVLHSKELRHDVDARNPQMIKQEGKQKRKISYVS